MSFFPPPAPPSDPWNPTPPGRSQGPVIAAIGAAVAVLIVGVIALAYAHGDGDDDTTESATPSTEPSEDSSAQEDSDGVGEPDLAELPGVLALVTFNADATDRRIQQVADEWDASPLLYGVVVMSEDELEDNIGLGIAAVSASGNDDDRDAIEEFVCGYQGAPGIALAGVDDPCELDGSTPSTPGPAPTLETLQLHVRFRTNAPPADTARIRNLLEQSSDIERVVVRADGHALTAFVHAPRTYEVCGVGIDLQKDEAVASVVLTGTYSCQPLADPSHQRPSTPEQRTPEVVIEVRVGPSVSAAHRETIRHALEDNGFYDDIDVDGGTGEPGTWTLLRLSGFTPGAPYVCPLAADLLHDPGVTVRETGPVDACPEF